MPKKHAFEMHQNLLAQVIKSQAGSLWKAVLELVMNSVDAGATKVDIHVATNHVSVSDNGKGMSKQEIETCFKIFGLPQTDEEKRFGKFRMGRGQAFAFGKNEWRTGPWLIHVDVEKDLSFELAKADGPEFDGCYVQVDLYKPIEHYELNAMIRDITQAVRYMSTQVKINGNQVSLDCRKEKWSLEDEYAYYKLSPEGAGIKLYNLGAFVQTISSGRYGCGGTVVSKKQLRVNFARNDLIQTCPVWKEITKVLRSQERDLVDLRKLNDSQRHALIRSLLNGETAWHEVWNSPLFPDVVGKYWAEKAIGREYERVTVAPKNDQIGERIHQQKRAFVLNNTVFELFHVSNWKSFVGVLPERHALRRLKYVPFDNLTKDIDTSKLLLTDEELNPRERITLEVLRHSDTYLRPYDTKAYERAKEERRLIAGISKTARAWTDGETYIAIARTELHDNKYGTNWGRAGFWVQLGLLLLHEYTHDEPTSATHQHSDDFYQEFHDLAQQRSLGPFVENCLSEFANKLDKMSKSDKKAAERTQRSHQKIAALAESVK